jgi:hypothetical protein
MKNFTYLFTLVTFFALTQVISQNNATYDITFTSTWNASEHESIPNSAHWSPLVGATHKTENVFMEVGNIATTGIKNVAELGANNQFENEVTSNSNSKEWLSQSISGYNQSTTISNVEFTTEHHYLTLVSMIAPSPDWFMAVNSLDLRNNTNTDWKTTFTIDVFVYDAGTDSGSSYASANMPNAPMPITKIMGSPFNGTKIGTLTLTLKSLSTDSFSKIDESIKLYPNPVTNGVLNVSKNNANALKTIEVYNVLGKLVKSFNTTELKSETLNVSNLNSGVYMFRLNTQNGIQTKKLIIK